MKILKLYYDSPGNFFLVQIIRTSKYVPCRRKSFQIKEKNFQAYIFVPIQKGQPSVNNPNGFNNNLIITFLSMYFNNLNNIHKVNQFTAGAFASIFPPSKKDDYNNTKDLHELFACFGGNLYLVEGDGFLQFETQSIKALVWIPEISFHIIKLIDCIELDASFTAAKPNVFASPNAIYRNTGIPLGLIIGPKECSELYSLFYKALKK